MSKCKNILNDPEMLFDVLDGVLREMDRIIQDPDIDRPIKGYIVHQIINLNFMMLFELCGKDQKKFKEIISKIVKDLEKIIA